MAISIVEIDDVVKDIRNDMKAAIKTSKRVHSQANVPNTAAMAARVNALRNGVLQGVAAMTSGNTILEIRNTLATELAKIDNIVSSRDTLEQTKVTVDAILTKHADGIQDIDDYAAASSSGFVQDVKDDKDFLIGEIAGLSADLQATLDAIDVV